MEDLSLVITLEFGDKPVKTAMSSFADKDGDLALIRSIDVDENSKSTTVRIYLPYRALPPGATGQMTVTTHIMSDAHEGFLETSTWTFANWPDPDAGFHNSTLALWIDLAIALVMTDGEVDRDEVRAIRQSLVNLYELDEHGVRATRDLLKSSSAAPQPLASLAARTRALLDPEDLLICVEFLYTVAAADGVVQDAEEAFIRALCSELGVPETERLEIKNRFVKDLKPYFDALELPVNATFDEVRRAYRKQTAEYHPDKVQAMAPKFRAFAEAEQRRINEAFDALRAHFETT